MSMTAFILIVGFVLLTMAAINEVIALLKWLYEYDQIQKRKHCYQICEEESVLLKWLQQPAE